jgi:putative oxidoreductase
MASTIETTTVSNSGNISDDTGKLILRIALGGILLFHGFAKIENGVEWAKGPLGNLGLPGFLGYGLYIAEVLAPILIILGIWTRLAALTIVFDMFMAVVLVLRDKILTIGPAGGWGIELESLIFLVAFALFFLGAGRFSVTGGRDRWD